MAGLLAIATPARAVPDPEALLLGPEERFSITVAWNNPYGAGASGEGHPHPVSAQSGTFWFFHPDNLEMLVKLLDGRPVNGRFWFFYTSLSSVEFTLTVSDRASGWERFYRNPPFAATTRLDTAGFGAEIPAGDLVFVGAHPDDELIASPLLGRLCREESRSCALLIATRGEAGACRRSTGCAPDLGALRERELHAAAARLGAEALSWATP